jgi:hypothetical protein
VQPNALAAYSLSDGSQLARLTFDYSNTAPQNASGTWQTYPVVGGSSYVVGSDGVLYLAMQVRATS